MRTNAQSATIALGLGTLVSHGFGLSLVPAMLPRIEEEFASGYGVLGQGAECSDRLLASGRSDTGQVVGEWFATGDRYHRDEDGYYVYEGRVDDMMKIGGLWVSPIKIENRLIEHSGALDSTCKPGGCELD